MEAYLANAAASSGCKSILCRAAAAGDCDVIRTLFTIKKNEVDGEVLQVDTTTPASADDCEFVYTPLTACPWHAGALPIHLAAEQGQTDVVEMLIDEFGCPANAPDALDVTPLMYAVGNAKFHILDVLASRGGAPDDEFADEVNYCHDTVEGGAAAAAPNAEAVAAAFAAANNGECAAMAEANGEKWNGW